MCYISILSNRMSMFGPNLLSLWRRDSSHVNEESLRGYRVSGVTVERSIQSLQGRDRAKYHKVVKQQ